MLGCLILCRLLCSLKKKKKLGSYKDVSVLLLPDLEHTNFQEQHQYIKGCS